MTYWRRPLPLRSARAAPHGRVRSLVVVPPPPLRPEMRTESAGARVCPIDRRRRPESRRLLLPPLPPRRQHGADRRRGAQYHHRLHRPREVPHGVAQPPGVAVGHPPEHRPHVPRLVLLNGVILHHDADQVAVEREGVEEEVEVLAVALQPGGLGPSSEVVDDLAGDLPGELDEAGRDGLLLLGHHPPLGPDGGSAPLPLGPEGTPSVLPGQPGVLLRRQLLDVLLGQLPRLGESVGEVVHPPRPAQHVPRVLGHVVQEHGQRQFHHLQGVDQSPEPPDPVRLGDVEGVGEEPEERDSQHEDVEPDEGRAGGAVGLVEEGAVHDALGRRGRRPFRLAVLLVAVLLPLLLVSASPPLPSSPPGIPRA
mmetsp:Transcript_30303/g.64327  ORF Transcript_30303/g.64327 Transcript_30303/m.64327 type:complete len:366 (-) Transcript_30303:44-1141(-)